MTEDLHPKKCVTWGEGLKDACPTRYAKGAEQEAD